MRSLKLRTTLLAVALTPLALACGAVVTPNPNLVSVPRVLDGGVATSACTITQIEKLATPQGLLVSPDGQRYVQIKADAAGITQVYLGDVGSSASPVCFSCEQVPGGPAPGKHKLMESWHPSGEWLFVGVEFDHIPVPFTSKEQDLGLLQTGVNLEMWVTRPGSGKWHQLTQFAMPGGAEGYTGPAITPDGRKVYFAQIVNGNIFAYTFGKWELIEADFVVDPSGAPSLQNLKNISPPNTSWIEPGTVSSDGKYLVLTLDTGLEPTKAAGMDQWLLELATGNLTNLNSSPDAWDEHGIFSPDSKKVVFMSSVHNLAYQASTAPFGIVGVTTEFMMMDVDGTNLLQITHFNEPGFPESTPGETSLAAVAFFTPDGTQLLAAQLLTGAHFPDQMTWKLTFAGPCGASPAP